MQENTNRARFLNSIVLYAKLGINTILALVTTRYALKVLGIDDFGLFSLIGSVITFINIVNTIMVSTCNRFLAVSIGKGDIKEVNKTFNINLTIFLGCALLLLMIGLPIGHWYVVNHVNYNGSIDNALLVLYFSVVGSVLSTIATPYNGLLMAKERFILFSAVDVFVHVVRFLSVISLLFFFSNKLMVYTIFYSLASIIPLIVYWAYCSRTFPDIVKWKLVKDHSSYSEVFKFSGWVAYGAIAMVGRNQAAAVLVNTFFNTAMNTALGLANSLNQYVMLFANSLTQPMQPQITKSYAAGNYERTNELLIMSTKFSFLLMLLISCPFFVGADWILGLWLGDVPSYAVSFTLLLIVDNLVMSFNSGLSLMLFADGRIALYQLLINTLRLVSVFAAYLVLKSGTPPEALFYTYITFSVIVVFATQYCLHKTLGYDNSILIKNSYVPSLAVLAIFLLVLLLPDSLHPLLKISISIIYLLLLEFFVGLSKKERSYIINRINKRH